MTQGWKFALSLIRDLWFAQVPHDKTTVRESLRSLLPLSKTSDSLKKKLKKIIFSKGFCSFPPFKAKNQIAPVALRSVAVSFLKSDREQIPQVALNKRATVSNLLRLLITKERPWAIRSCHSLKKSNWAIGSKKNEQITLSLFRSK